MESFLSTDNPIFWIYFAHIFILKCLLNDLKTIKSYKVLKCKELHIKKMHIFVC